jgi:hypothetical protein
MTMQTWDVTVTLDVALPDEHLLDDILAELPPHGAVGRSPWSDRLAVSVSLRGLNAGEAGKLGALLVAGAVDMAGLGDNAAAMRVVGVEVLDEQETERRSAEPQAPDLMSTAEAAEALGITPAAMRQRGQRGELGAVKIGDAGWAFSRRAVEAAAARRAELQARGSTVPAEDFAPGADPNVHPATARRSVVQRRRQLVDDAQRELRAAREALAESEHGADEDAARQRYEQALDARNAALRAADGEGADS